ncbi:MAG: ATP-binding protein [Saprospiraceae bacterium]
MRIFLFKLFLLFFSLLALNSNGMNVDSVNSPILWLEEQNTLGQKLLKKNQLFNEAVDIFQSAYDFANARDISNEASIDVAIGYGIALYKNGDIQNSYSILLEVLPKIESSKLKIKAEVNQILGMTLVFKNKFPEGYKYQMEALKYYIDIADSTGMMNVYFDLGSNFGTQGQSKLALKHFEKGIAIAKVINDPKMTILGITSLGNTWASMKKYEKALEYINESIELAKEMKDDEELAWASLNCGHILGLLKRYKEAKFYLDQAYDLSFILGNKLLTAYALEQTSDLQLSQGNLTEALSSLDKGYNIFVELGQTNSIKSATKKYAEIYFQQKEFEKYKEYTDKYISLKDSIFSNEMMETMSNLKQDFEIHQIERENQIALLTKDQELTKVNNYATMSITCAAIIISFLFLILMYSRNKSAIEKNEILEAKNAEILRQNQILADSNQDLEKFAYIISHDLKEPLRNINGFTKLLIKKLNQYNIDPGIYEYASFITNGTKQMSDLLNGLLDYSKIGVDKSERQLINLDDIVWQVKNSLKIQLDEKNCEIKINSLPKVLCRPTQLTQVFQNLIANALKFGHTESNMIIIGAKDKGNEYEFFVQDEGIGIEAEYQKDIFVVFKRLHNRGIYSGSGIGLATCKKVVEDHGGRIWVRSEKNEGACFFFTLPKEPISKNTTPKTDLNKTEESFLEMA